MAAPLTQEEIDELLNSAGDVEELGEDDEGFEPDIIEEEPQKGGTKNFGIPEPSSYRFKFAYVSPIVKSDDILYNPESIEENNDKTIVRNIFNFSKHYNKRRKH